MITPVVTENVHQLEAIEHDTFIDDLAPRAIVLTFPVSKARSQHAVSSEHRRAAILPLQFAA